MILKQGRVVYQWYYNKDGLYQCYYNKDGFINDIITRMGFINDIIIRMGCPSKNNYSAFHLYCIRGGLILSTENDYLPHFLLLWIILLLPFLRRVLQKGAPLEFLFQKLPQEVSGVESKIKLYTENNTVIVLNKIIFPRLRYLCLIMRNSQTIL